MLINKKIVLSEKKKLQITRSLSISAFIFIVGICKIIAEQQELESLTGYRDATVIGTYARREVAEEEACKGKVTLSQSITGQPSDFSGTDGSIPILGQMVTCSSGLMVRVFQRSDNVYVAIYIR